MSALHEGKDLVSTVSTSTLKTTPGAITAIAYALLYGLCAIADAIRYTANRR